MLPTPFSLRPDYWTSFEVQEADLEFLYNHLLELEIPLTPEELTAALVKERIHHEIETLKQQQQAGGAFYAPKNTYKVGQSVTFPALDWKSGQVVSLRPGSNPELAQFEVIEVALTDGTKKLFAASLDQHILNQPITINTDDPLLNIKAVLNTYGEELSACLERFLESNPDLVRIATAWFPRALLVDISIGHLNLAEAVLEMSGGKPLSTTEIIAQIELPTDTNPKLTEFSLNLSLQEDGRFDEVGPTGDILWCVKSMEPQFVQNRPPFLQFQPVEYNQKVIEPFLAQMESVVKDELNPHDLVGKEEINEITLSLIYPHWRAGTLPLTDRISRLFPTALESPRIQFLFVDGDTGENFEGWVVRSERYVFGLREWYSRSNLIPGSLVKIQRSSKPGQVVIRAERHRPNREWIRTALVGADGGVVFAMLKQQVTARYNELMAIAIPDPAGIEQIWDQTKHRASLENIVSSVMQDLAKLNPQGHVHATELYACVNMLRRCSTGLLLSMLVERPWSQHVGDLYFRPVNPQEAEASA